MPSSTPTGDRPPSIGDRDTAAFLEGFRIEKTQVRRAVAHDQIRRIVRQSPALSRVGEHPPRLERRAVVDEGHVRLPGQLNQIVLPDGNPLAEMRRRHIPPLQHLAGPRGRLGPHHERTSGVQPTLSCRRNAR